MYITQVLEKMWNVFSFSVIIAFSRNFEIIMFDVLTLRYYLDFSHILFLAFRLKLLSIELIVCFRLWNFIAIYLLSIHFIAWFLLSYGWYVVLKKWVLSLLYYFQNNFPLLNMSKMCHICAIVWFVYITFSRSIV